MTQEDKELLLKDLCARLPYGVKVHTSLKPICTIFGKPSIYSTVVIDGAGEKVCNISDIKPYLFPLSNMTDEMWDKEFMGFGITEFTRDSFKYGCETLALNNSNPNLSSIIGFINRLIKNHFDIYGLIPKGLAIDATGLNIY